MIAKTFNSLCKLAVYLIFSTIFIGNAADGGENDESTQRQVLEGLYRGFLIADSVEVAQKCTNLQQVLRDENDFDAVAEAFKSLVRVWKRVEATYILGGFDVATIDYPFLIDMYHMGNENVNKKLDRALQGDSPASTALFKNNYKTINALEYILFTGEWQPRRAEFAAHISASLCAHFDDIAAAYANNLQSVLDDREKAMALILNGLVDSIYKTREWRVGDPSGLSRKYSGKPDARRQEYPFSKISLAAITAILEAHEHMISDYWRPNFADLARMGNASEALLLAQTKLKNAQNSLAAIAADSDFNPRAMQQLFDDLSELQSAYYQNLVRSLDVVAKILEADGD